MRRKFTLLLLIALFSAAAFQTTHAQGPKTNTVSFNGVSFSFDSSIATSVNIIAYPGDPRSAEQPGGPQPRNVTFSLYTQKPDNAGGDAPVLESFIIAYKAADWKGYPEFETRFAEFDKLLATSPDLSSFMTPSKSSGNKELPFLPVYPASQVIRSQAKYIKTDQVSGYAFISAYRQDVAPFTAHDFVYLFVGTTANKQTVVSVNLRLDTKLFPKDLPSNFDYASFEKNYDKYMQESSDKLNKGKDTDFAPSLSVAESLVKSISVK